MLSKAAPLQQQGYSQQIVRHEYFVERCRYTPCIWTSRISIQRLLIAFRGGKVFAPYSTTTSIPKIEPHKWICLICCERFFVALLLIVKLAIYLTKLRVKHSQIKDAMKLHRTRLSMAAHSILQGLLTRPPPVLPRLNHPREYDGSASSAF